MLRRLRIYGVGLGLGLIMAWALFLRGRNTKNYTAWTPNNRILEEVRLDSSLILDDAFWCEITCLGFTSIEYTKLLNDGNVVFGDSQVKNWPRSYKIELATEKKGTLVLVYSKTEQKHFEVVSVTKKGEDISCDC
tara:strand:- start:9983 stop:10387 length:405 start_codon:yes stop_codon:yes gene_type:complete